jgi:polyhydroxyalkanoate synthesis regulator phasin
MIDLIKKTVLAGIGATVTTKEKIEGMLNEYVDKGKLSAHEAKSLAERIVADGKQEFESAKGDLGERINDLLKKSNFATREEIVALQKHLHNLEHKLETHQAMAHAHETKHHAKS